MNFSYEKALLGYMGKITQNKVINFLCRKHVHNKNDIKQKNQICYRASNIHGKIDEFVKENFTISKSKKIYFNVDLLSKINLQEFENILKFLTNTDIVFEVEYGIKLKNADIEKLKQFETLANQYGLSFYFDEDGVNYNLDDVIKVNDLLNSMQDEIENSKIFCLQQRKERKLSNAEKYIYAYKFVTQFHYHEEENTEPSHLSRNLTSIVKNDFKYFVCLGQAKMLKALLDRLNIPCILANEKVIDETTKNFPNEINHTNCRVYIKDKIHEIDGIYKSDPSWDSKDKKLINHKTAETKDISSLLYAFITLSQDRLIPESNAIDTKEYGKNFYPDIKELMIKINKNFIYSHENITTNELIEKYKYYAKKYVNILRNVNRENNAVEQAYTFCGFLNLLVRHGEDKATEMITSNLRLSLPVDYKVLVKEIKTSFNEVEMKKILLREFKLKCENQYHEMMDHSIKLLTMKRVCRNVISAMKQNNNEMANDFHDEFKASKYMAGMQWNNEMTLFACDNMFAQSFFKMEENEQKQFLKKLNHEHVVNVLQNNPVYF
ncbi:MAG: hypothetical protein ACI4L6_02420 [Candidatus Onthoplasma sp.]